MISPGMKIAVLGCGISGRAAVKYALKNGAEVLISDNRDPERFVVEEAALLENSRVSWEAGGHTESFLLQADLVLLSPGLAPEMPLLVKLRSAGMELAGELAVAAGKISRPVVAVTGTNGKTTVTTLIGEMFKASGKKVFVGGNIGTPLYEYLLDPQDYDVVVAEVSSFQLASAGNFSPDVGVLLNITPDHLDWHGSLENYRDAKLALFTKQTEKDFAVVNGDDPLCRNLPGNIAARRQFFGLSDVFEARVKTDRVILSAGAKTIEFDLAGTSFHGLIGASNCAAAILAALDLGCREDEIRKAMEAFVPLSHRMQFITEKDGVKYVDDSKATNTGAVLAALNEYGGNVVLIAGGRDKGDDYTLLRDAVKEKVRCLVLIGEAADLIESAVGDLTRVCRAQSMKEAVKTASASAQSGDVVLLSPACASFDMFRSYGHRGDVFQAEVEALTAADRSNGSL